MIWNPYIYSEYRGNCMEIARHHQWACGNTSTNAYDLTIILENLKIRNFHKIFRKVKYFYNVLFINLRNVCLTDNA